MVVVGLLVSSTSHAHASTSESILLTSLAATSHTLHILNSLVVDNFLFLDFAGRLIPSSRLVIGALRGFETTGRLRLRDIRFESFPIIAVLVRARYTALGTNSSMVVLVVLRLLLVLQA